jgi:Protein of unknown function (DUF2877)
VTVVAAPVLARLPPGAPLPRDVGVVDLGGFVALVTPPGTPWLPNAITLDPGPLVVWDPVLPALEPGPRLAARGRAVLAALGPAGPSGPLSPPVAALADWDGALGALLGRGGGLTPEGDDLLAGALAVAAAAGGAPALPHDLRERTTALSATLLELAAAGCAPRPLHAVLDLGRQDWRAALRELEGLGASSGRAIARGAATAAAALGAARCAQPLAARHLQA